MPIPARVIHKIVYMIEPNRVDQVFTIPVTAEIVEIGWDAQTDHGIAVWYTFTPPLNGNPDDLGPMREWKLTRRVTGQAYSPDLIHLKTLVKQGYAWHLFDSRDNHIPWTSR